MQTSVGKVVAVIPARGGSKGVPRKNIRVLAGRPLIAHSIQAARQSKHVSRVIVSTEDAEISRIAREWGAEVVPRPLELASDTASSESALLHVLDYLSREEHYTPDVVVFLQATSPLRQPGDIDRAVEVLYRKEADSVFSVRRSHDFYWRKDGETLTPVNYDYRRRPRRQELGEEYMENGSIFVVRTELLRETGNRLGGRIAVYEMGEWESFQIDTERDVVLLEQLMGLERERAGVGALGAGA